MALNTMLLAAALGAPSATVAPPYTVEESMLAQRYYRQCRAEQRLQNQISKDLNEKNLPMPPTSSFRDKLTDAERHDADLVCLGAVLQNFDDMQAAWQRSETEAPDADTPPPAGGSR